MPRAGLSADRLTDEAWELMDGGSPLSLAAVAQRVGVQVPSLYKHVASLDALRQLVAVRAKADLGNALAAAAAGTTDAGDAGDPAALVRLAAAYREWATRHPGLYESTLRAAEPSDASDVEVSERASNLIYETLRATGVPDHALVDATRAFRSLLHGFVAIEAAGGFKLPVDVDRSFESITRVFGRSLGQWE